jgi:hypothetical protein
LDAALELGFPCGGWCPHGRQAEDGVIPARYPVVVLPGAGYRQRTRQNVEDSDATVILAPGELSGGTALTKRFCEGVWPGRSQMRGGALIGRRQEPRFLAAETQPLSEKGPKAPFSDGGYKPCLVIDAAATSSPEAAREVLRFLQMPARQCPVLNVAGPRASGWPEGAAYARAVVLAVIQEVRRGGGVNA